MSISLVFVSSEQAPVFTGQMLFNGNWMPIDVKVEMFLFSLLDLVYANLAKQMEQPTVDCLMLKIAESLGYVAHAYVTVDRSILLMLIPVEAKCNSNQLKLFFLAAEALLAAESMNPFYKRSTHVMDEPFCFALAQKLHAHLLNKTWG
ncbi:putative TRAPPC2 [Giardia duodenalis]|uniref:TRAPPC2 n=2 Tax=Giardia intestinalis TaxID=5741 RepID=A8BME3_GIAIC|nr:putative TRAPPC2 [Giardia intestinalis]ESU36389.1 Hypothetical protein DHA2_11312 [Giardia intestinalis]KAE8303998.1 putative TRAPPC2 [Giardia intestinalis]|eukprot:XP_001706080.1 TRAPPC2, putative [Giardia lamblia ATCC 50803]